MSEVNEQAVAEAVVRYFVKFHMPTVEKAWDKESVSGAAAWLLREWHKDLRELPAPPTKEGV